ncbi:hypothetical protein FAUST_11247 [Fusarium austroamericanum]|uniref:Uncharacterized protein n=1 Tax=Fusarium austroamericanum TaxID=282268 RepID=A0AAN5Z0S5_FUSAU|nr:hypothetical protein FAUST_11247 [Fusarium austroamericanum]
MLNSIQRKYTPESLPYHIIVPDLVGFGFSSRPPLRKSFGMLDNARILVKFMHVLGFTSDHGGYTVQGGNIGGFLGPRVATLDPETCRLLHVNMLTIQPLEGTNIQDDMKAGKYTQAEIDSLDREKKVRPWGLSIGEKFLEWSDPTTGPSLELILTIVSFYWFSRCFHTSLWHCRSMYSGDSGLGSQLDGVKCPVGYSWFRRENCNPPKGWLDQLGVVQWFKAHERGGHFAALEQPEALWEDVEDFLGHSNLQ